MCMLMSLYVSDFHVACICNGDQVHLCRCKIPSPAHFNQRLCVWPITGQSQAATSQPYATSTLPRDSRQLRDGGIIQRAQSCIVQTGPPASPIGRSTRRIGKTKKELYAAELSSSPPHRHTGEDFSRTASSTSPPKHSTHISSGSAFYSRIIEQQVEKLHVNNLDR